MTGQPTRAGVQRGLEVMAMQKRLMVALVCLVILSAGPSAQTADFTGRWRVNHAAGDPPSTSTAEQLWEVTQTATELRLRLVVNGREVSSHTWPLGGAPIATRRDSIEAMTSVTVNQGELVIAGSGTTGTGVAAEIKEQWVIDPATKNLRVAKIHTVGPGGTTLTRRLVLEKMIDR
jgi:hypothetical protein